MTPRAEVPRSVPALAAAAGMGAIASNGFSSATSWPSGPNHGFAAETASVRIVPVTLIIGGRTGLTLWAPPWSGDAVVRHQALLGEGDRVLMFPNVASLADYIGSDRPNDLSDHPGWAELRRLGTDRLLPPPDDIFDLDGTYDLVADGPDPTRIAALARLVFIAGVVADCCGDQQLLDLLSQSPGLSDVETGIGNYFERTGSATGNQRWFDLAETFGSTWERVCARVGSHLTWDAHVSATEDDRASGTGQAALPAAPADPVSAAASAAAASAAAASDGPVSILCPAGHMVRSGAAFCSICGASVPVARDAGGGDSIMAPRNGTQPQQPLYPQPQYVQQPELQQPDLPQPDLQQPQYVQPDYQQPRYTQPQYTQPQYAQTQYAQTQYAQAQYPQTQYPQTPYPQPVRAPRRRPRGLLVAGAVVLALVVAGAAAIIIKTTAGPATTTVNGRFVLTDSQTAYANCTGQDGYSDISPGVAVILTSQDAKILGSTVLGVGDPDTTAGTCTYNFSIADVPEDQQQYAMEVASRGKVVNSKSEMVANGWQFQITLGH